MSRQDNLPHSIDFLANCKQNSSVAFKNETLNNLFDEVLNTKKKGTYFKRFYM